MYLMKGVLPSIRSKATKTHADFSDFDSFVAYLQEVEDTVPERVMALGSTYAQMCRASPGWEAFKSEPIGVAPANFTTETT